MRIIFIGASAFGLRCLASLDNLKEIKVVGVITNPKRFSISYSKKPVTNVLHADFVSWAKNRSLPTFEMKDSMQDPLLEKWIASLDPDLFIVAGWYHLIPKKLREIAPAIGLHASLLPKYSGGAPLVWAMINGEKKTGITLFKMDDGVDSGPIIGQLEEKILPLDTIQSLYARIEAKGIELLKKYIPDLAAGSAYYAPQDENMREVYPQRNPKDGLIDWRKSIFDIDRFIRAQTYPYPGAFTTINGKVLIIWSATPTINKMVETTPSITKAGNDYIIVGLDGALILGDVSFEGKKYSKERLGDLFISGGQLLDLNYQ